MFDLFFKDVLKLINGFAGKKTLCNEQFIAFLSN